VKPSSFALLQRLCIIAGALTVLAIWLLAPRGELIDKDAEQNLAMAYNLRHHGSFSLDTDRAPDALRPSRYREPLPAVALAAYMAVFDGILKGHGFRDLLEGDNARLLQYSNIAWGLLLVVVMWRTARILRIPEWLAVLAIALAHIPLIDHYGTLYTEVCGAALIALASYLALLALTRLQVSYFFYAGLSFGALALTKASFLYVAIALLAIYLLCGLSFVRASARARFVLGSTFAAAIGTALVVAPWMLRNQVQFGSPEIADRGGLVLVTRAVKNGMTAEEYMGTFYAYAPRILQWPMGKLTGFQQKDLQAGGRLQRLKRGANPGDEQAAAEGRVNDAISYYWRAKALRAPRLAAFEAAGHPNALGAADAELKKQAIARIEADPLRHLKMTLPFMWRGAPFMFPFFLFVLVYAWRKDDAPVAAYVLPTLGLIAFYALLSHFIPRYAEPNAPIAAICAALLVNRWLEGRAMRCATQPG
jgi:hypothetical protein